MSGIDLRIEKWKSKLLDLGKRNRLINYRETKRSNLKIILPDIDELYKRLVVNEESLDFPCPANEGFLDIDENIDDRIIYGEIKTDRTINEQQKTLRNLRNKAKTALEEQGVNILYLAFGFLKWKENNISEQTLISPLILVPITLTLESLTAPFVIGLYEDEITLNPTLSHKLEGDFGITLPNFDNPEEGVDTFLSSINSLALNNGMEVLYETGISLFSFLKINMYKDLDRNKEKIRNHPILKALSGDTTDVKLPQEELNDYNHDINVRPIDIFQVLDADSSQQDAILYVKKGVSFVLQGPPGTGKSQTITNVIAESLAEGKKVLFVSEKMAALEVVHKRLSQTGLSDFCLTLHNHKANKKEILNELGKVLNLNKFKMQEEALYQLELLTAEKEKLNLYDEQLHTPCSPLEKSIYEINGRLAKLVNAPDLIFSLSNIKNITSQNLNQYIHLIEELSRIINRMNDDYKANPWRNCHVEVVTHELRHDIGTYLGDLAPKLKTFSNVYALTKNNLGLEISSTFTGLVALIEVLEVSSKSPKIPLEWLDLEDIVPLIKQAEKYKSLKTELGVLYSELSPKYTDNFFSIPANATKETLAVSMQGAKQILNLTKYLNEDSIVDSLEHLIPSLETSIKSIAILKTQIGNLRSQLGLLPATNLKDVNVLSEFLECILMPPKPIQEWFDIEKFQLAKKLYLDAKAVFSELDTETKSITSRFDTYILDLDCSAFLKRFKTEYTSVFRILNKQH
jgi:hypothetical protein